MYIAVKYLCTLLINERLTNKEHWNTEIKLLIHKDVYGKSIFNMSVYEKKTIPYF